MLIFPKNVKHHSDRQLRILARNQSQHQLYKIDQSVSRRQHVNHSIRLSLDIDYVPDERLHIEHRPVPLMAVIMVVIL